MRESLSITKISLLQDVMYICMNYIFTLIEIKNAPRSMEHLYYKIDQLVLC